MLFSVKVSKCNKYFQQKQNTNYKSMKYHLQHKAQIDKKLTILFCL